MTKSVHNPLLVRLLPKLLSLPSDLSNNIIKFNNYYLHYNDKVATNSTWTFVPYFLCNFGNLLTTFPILADNNRTRNIELDLVTRKEEPPKTFLYFLLGAL